MRPSFKECKVWSDEKYVSHKLAFDAKDPHLNFTFNVLKVLYLFLCLSLSLFPYIFFLCLSLSLFISVRNNYSLPKYKLCFNFLLLRNSMMLTLILTFALFRKKIPHIFSRQILLWAYVAFLVGVMPLRSVHSYTVIWNNMEISLKSVRWRR